MAGCPACFHTLWLAEVFKVNLAPHLYWICERSSRVRDGHCLTHWICTGASFHYSTTPMRTYLLYLFYIYVFIPIYYGDLLLVGWKSR